MLPIEPRLKPLGATIIHYADSDAKAKFTRCHSFSGYVPYFLADNAPEACSNGGASPETDSTDVGEDMNVPVWPDTDDEAVAPKRRPGTSSSSESGDDDKSQMSGPSSVWTVSAVPAFAWEASWEMPLTQAGLGQGVAPIGAKVIEGFGKALRKAIGEVPKSKPKEESCFHSELKKMPDIEEFVWHLHQSGCPPVCFVYAFVYICRMSELNSGKALPKNRLEPSPLEQMAKRLQRPKDASFYAHVGDVSVAELNQLESKFFELLQWKADVPAKAFKRIFRLLSQAAA
eukprot:g18899.t1